MKRRAFVVASAAAAVAPRAATAQGKPIRVGAGLIEPQAQAYYARAQGMFRAHGLDVQIVTMPNGSAQAAAVAGGDLQIGCTSILGLAQAHQHGLPFVIVAPGGIHDSRYPGSAVLVLPNSPIVAPRDLNGKVVAVATAGGLDQLITSVLVDKNGGSAASVKFVEIRPVAQLDALLAQRVDAACMEDPELAQARPRTRSLGDGEAAIADVFVETAWFATHDWLANNADVAARFRAAIFEAGQWAMANPEAAGAVLQNDVNVRRPRATQRFATSTDVGQIQVLLDAAARYKFIPATTATALLAQIVSRSRACARRNVRTA